MQDTTADEPGSPLPSLLADIANVRDLGGLPCADGRHVRRGLLFRAGLIASATARDTASLAALGLRSVCDLRRPFEREHAASLWQGGTSARLFHTAGGGESGGNAREESAILRHLRRDPTPAGGIAAMLDAYADMPAAFAPILADLFAALEDPATTPMLIHCHAGKDRTGFVCAMILLALGVPRADVMADYLLTARYQDREALFRAATGISGRQDAAAVIPRAALEPVAGVRAAFLQAAFDAIDRQHGSLGGYMAQVGLGAAREARLRELLTA